MSNEKIKEYSLLYLKSGVVLIGEVVKKSTSLITLFRPCILNTRYEDNGHAQFIIMPLIDPVLSDDEYISIKNNELLTKPLLPTVNVIATYNKYLSDNKEEK